jgi:hypothetical protein
MCGAGMTTFTKIYNNTVLEDLEFIINEEFNLPIRYDDTYRGNAFFHIMPQGEELIEIRTDGALREYSLQITYFEKNYGTYTQRSGLDNRARVVERLKKLIRNNIAGVDDVVFFLTSNGKNFLTSNSLALVPAGDTELDWHHARIESIEYDEDAENNRYLTGTVDFRCVVEEIYTT